MLLKLWKNYTNRSQTEAYISGYMLLQTSEKAKYYGEMAQLEYMRMYQGLLNDIENGKLTKQRVLNEFENNRILKSDATLKEKTLDKLIEKVEYEVESLKNNRGANNAFQAANKFVEDLKELRQQLLNENRASRPHTFQKYRRSDGTLDSLAIGFID